MRSSRDGSTTSSLEDGTNTNQTLHPLMPIRSRLARTGSDPADSPSTVVALDDSLATAPSTMRTKVADAPHAHIQDVPVARDSPDSPGERLTGRTSTMRSRGLSLGSRMSSLIRPSKKIGDPPSVGSSIKAIVTSSWLNVLLIFIPVSWVLHYTIHNDTVIFVTCFLAIIPLAKLLGFATEELAIRVGDTIGGLLNATLGNAVELIISIIALVKCELAVVQASLVGSILSNLLLVLGMCFFAGGIRFAEQGFMVGASQLNSSLLTLSVVAMLIPAVFHVAVGGNNNSSTTGGPDISDQQEGQDILKMSHGVAIIMLFIYVAMLVFQLWSHAYMYGGGVDVRAQPSTRYPPKHKKEQAGADNVQTINAPHVHDPDVDPVETPELSVPIAIALLVIVTVLTALTAEFLVDSISGLVANTPIKVEWVGLILLPIVGNAAEHVTAVTVSVKDKLDLAIGVAVGSSIQISLLVIPLMVILGWIMDKPLTLLFDPFQSVVLFLSVITVNYVVADGRSNWLEGMILMSLYVLIATALWFYPGSDPASLILTCT